MVFDLLSSWEGSLNTHLQNKIPNPLRIHFHNPALQIIPILGKLYLLAPSLQISLRILEMISSEPILWLFMTGHYDLRLQCYDLINCL